MKDFFEQVLKVDNSAFTIAEAKTYHAINNFHNHPELELIYIISGEGTFSIGNTSKRISGDTMIIIGCNVPHMFKFETNRYYDYSMKSGKIPKPLQLLTLHFDPNKLGSTFMTLPENNLINNLLNGAKNGLLINENSKAVAVDFIHRIENSARYEQLPLLLQLLNKIAEGERVSNLAGETEKKIFNRIDEVRLTKIYLYTMDNFYKDIKLKEIANIIHMVPKAFCHYFKLRTGQTYFDFLLTVRIENSCKLIRETNENINSISRDSGFNNLSNFNRYFKLATGSTPMEYRRKFREF
ncbi:helix-turn-helix transcriptional regulator [Mucilaginibacter rubeus]|uniref:Helix-turn-helix domain-containing protein n=1 Tax=Mucilaginibacter rubeus TaxID=2027860 RepID=A0AAE6JAY6_9SPHI|nr:MULTISPECIES: AraC family transcriptional regulator [Mucilaginibacter]QEM02309.1 helix-turn-helix transcriptional regulator [Mucilaginibacter rubeus]QEM14935.1 helix-turn-helix transcriptional regulator [Mucilaginibacter gossypii]QTE42350.1 helix-turn-helix domain-containing protein [Mucilaginibacter rubeus]QTE48951.1 helix-turn-helix domain-containing protein [Mucilaginibacter rubeus]QTE54049.1 helix-turn-helix domain-containing protein [Mucilaginibacter rubeus]